MAWEEVVDIFGGRPGTSRARLMSLLTKFRAELRSRGITGLLILNGSFVSTKQDPGDIDAIFVYDETCEDMFRENTEVRELVDYDGCKRAGLGDILVFPRSTVLSYPMLCRLDAFDFDKGGAPKGVIEVKI